MKFKSSTRIDAIVSEIIPGREVWDFCCDHGLIGLHAMRLGLSQSIHFVDPVEEIIQRLRDRLLPFFESVNSEFSANANLVAKNRMQNVNLNLWTCLGQNIPIEVRGSLIIAGVGGELTLQILESLDQQNKLLAEKLILCPNKDETLFLERENILKFTTSSYELEKSFTVVEKDREKLIFTYLRS